MLKYIGGILIVCGAGGAGIGKALQFYRQLRYLKELAGAIEILKCELNYTLLPVAELCRICSTRVNGIARVFLRSYALSLEQGNTRQRSAQLALENAKGLDLPNSAQMALLELFGNLGRYDLDGENRLLSLSEKRINEAHKQLEQEKRPLAKGYAVLGVCVGVALVILLA